MYRDKDDHGTTSKTEKPTSLNLSQNENKIEIKSYRDASPSTVPKPSSHSLASPSMKASSASPSSRRDSLVKSRELSPECHVSYHKRKSSTFSTKDSIKDRSRSKSRERECSSAVSSNESIDSKMRKQKGSVFSIFKPKKPKSKSNSAKTSAENLQYEGITNVEFTFDTTKKERKYHEQLLEGDSIRIPLHSPSEYERRSLLTGKRQEENGKCLNYYENRTDSKLLFFGHKSL